MRLLSIANPAAYRKASTDVPLGYARLAAHREVDLFHADTEAMLAASDMIAATAVPSDFEPADFDSLSDLPTTDHPPSDFDVAFCRTLKPFPNGYLRRLQQRSASLRFVNDPAGIERQLEPSFVLKAAAAFMPPTLITADQLEAQEFLAQHCVVVAKRANSCGGRGVFKVSSSGNGKLVSDNILAGKQTFDDFGGMYAHLAAGGDQPLLFAAFLHRVTEGEKRVIALDGKILGAYLRTSASGHWIQNVSFGATCQLASVTAEDRRLVERTCGAYQREGIHLLGYDLLLDDNGAWKISEINAGNIGGVFRLETMGVRGVTADVVAWLRAFAGAVRS